jgi:hypothetical protein
MGRLGLNGARHVAARDAGERFQGQPAIRAAHGGLVPDAVLTSEQFCTLQCMRTDDSGAICTGRRERIARNRQSTGTFRVYFLKCPECDFLAISEGGIEGSHICER